ncbi:VOC family protein [Paenibacillus sp. MWE-103]|uniref:VOC family protein n=1 Tax=Paenibacillus artemisiicola TaxID=1172618 RepID=A0ABS3WER6_9BACL|nr:VOC family protein [Paenibacillus artemisiicola]MBO7746825.1 VOC family protein [Paenibacillus artemisiicola]
MKLNHLNVCVPDLNEAVTFFRDVFGFELNGRHGDAIAAMTDDDGFSLVLSSLRPGEEGYPKDFHLGFYVDTIADVDGFHDKLAAAGIAAEQRPRRIRNGYTLYFTALGGILFEVTSFQREAAAPQA